MLRQDRTIPEGGSQIEVTRGLAQITLKPPPILRIQRPRSSRSLAFPQSVQAALFETAHPALHGRAVLAKQLRDFSTGSTRAHQQQSMQSVVVTRLLATSDLLLDHYSHHLSVLNLQLAHRLSPREKNDAMITSCCIIYVVVFSKFV